MPEETDKSLPQKIDEMYGWFTQKSDKEKKKLAKEFKLPSAGRVSKGKAKKGWVGIMKIDENRNVGFEKHKIEQMVLKTKDDIHHASDGREILFWKGRPLIIQPSWRLNPLEISEIPKENNVYGQKPVLAAIQTGAYTEAKKKGGFGGIGIIIAIIVVGYLVGHSLLKIF